MKSFKLQFYNLFFLSRSKGQINRHYYDISKVPRNTALLPLPAVLTMVTTSNADNGFKARLVHFWFRVADCWPQLMQLFSTLFYFEILQLWNESGSFKAYASVNDIPMTIPGWGPKCWALRSLFCHFQFIQISSCRWLKSFQLKVDRIISMKRAVLLRKSNISTFFSISDFKILSSNMRCLLVSFFKIDVCFDD